MPTEFRFRIEYPDQFELLSTTVELRYNTLVETTEFAGGGPPRVRRNQPDVGEWRAFRNAIESRGIDIWSWSGRYDSSSAHVIRWQVEITYADRSMKSSGRSWQGAQHRRVLRLLKRVRFLMDRIDGREQHKKG